MGYMKHHSIAVASWKKETIEEAHRLATSIFFENQVTPILRTTINQEHSFFIGPDGSKEFWDTSNTGDVMREEFIRSLKKFEYEDGSSSIRYCEFSWAENDGDCEILSHN